jgi:DNA-binding PadR family transcriptional regulator
MTNNPDLGSHLPLRPIEFEILLVLIGGDSHGYAIIKEAEDRWPGARPMETGTLYRALRRLTQAGMVAPVDRRPTGESVDERRRYFTITPAGKALAAAEARRLESQVNVARVRNLLSGAEGGAQ